MTSPRIVLVALLAALAARSPLAAQSRIVRDTLDSPALAGNKLGDPSRREELVYLPPSYATSPNRHYPVLYLLHGFTSAPSEWLDSTYDGLDLQVAMDSLIGRAGHGMPEFIVVMPDGNDALGGGFYTDSPVAGLWATYIVRDLIRHVEARYRTVPDRRHRALAGHSMGGFGALVLGSERPDLFGLLYAMSPCCASFVGEFAPDSRAWEIVDSATTWHLASNASGARLVMALAIGLSPAPDRPRLYGELPIHPGGDGRLVPQRGITIQWRARMPIGMVHRLAKPGVAAPAIYLDYGTHDQIASVIPGVAEVSHALDSLGIRYVAMPFDGDHVNRVRQRVSEHLLPTVGAWLRKQGGG